MLHSSANPLSKRITMTFSTTTLPAAYDLLAPNGFEVRVLHALTDASMAHFLLSSGQVSRAIRHRRLEVIWYIIAGLGEIWRSNDDREEVSPLAPGMSLRIPAGTIFQIRSVDDEPLTAVVITLPPRSVADETEIVGERWEPTVRDDRLIWS
jgi:mannose-6-phosphate isomerase-like protein (cupin superfamily)